MNRALYPANQETYYNNILATPIGVSLPVNPKWPGTYKSSVQKFNEHHQNGTVSVESVLDYIKEGLGDYHDGAISLSTLKVRIFALKKALTELLQQQGRRLELAVLLQELDSVKLPREGKTSRIEALTLEQLDLLVDNIQEHYRPLCAFLINTGARVQDTLNLKFSDCIVQKGSGVVQCYANERKSLLTMSIELFEKIKQEYNGEVWLFETKNGKRIDRFSVYRAIQKSANYLGWVDGAGKSLVNPNLLRYTYLVHSDSGKAAQRPLPELVKLA